MNRRSEGRSVGAETASGVHRYVGIDYSGAADERQFRVMCDREQWFRVVMGQEKVAKLIPADFEASIPLPASLSDSLSFELGLDALGA